MPTIYCSWKGCMHCYVWGDTHTHKVIFLQSFYKQYCKQTLLLVFNNQPSLTSSLIKYKFTYYIFYLKNWRKCLNGEHSQHLFTLAYIYYKNI
jgi:hypothetical protein